MAFTVTARHAGNNATTAGQTLATDSQTPTASSLFIVAAGGVRNGQVAAYSWQAPVGGGYTYTNLQVPNTAFNWAADATFAAGGAVWRADVSGSPSAHTVTVDPHSGTETCFLGAVCFDITGHSSSTPVQSKAGGADAGAAGDSVTGTITLDSAPTAGNLIVVCWMVAGDVVGGVTSPTSNGQTFTTITNQTPANCHVSCFYRVATGAENATISTTDLGQTVGAYAVIAFEIAAAGGAPPTDFSINPLRLQPKIIGNPFIGDIGRGPGANVTTFPRQPAIPMVLWYQNEEIAAVSAFNGTAALTATAATTTTGEAQGAAALTATAAITASGVVATSSTASLTATAAITAAGTVATSSAASLTVTDAITGTGTAQGVTSLTATATITAAGSLGGGAFNGTASLTATDTITAAGQPQGAVSLTETATITAVGAAQSTGTAALTETATITAAGQQTGTAARTETATITAAGQTQTTTALTATATITAAGATQLSGTAALTATATITASASGNITGTAAVNETATITAVGNMAATGTTSLTATAAITAAGTVTGTATRTTTVTITANGQPQATVSRTTAATITAAGNMAASGSVSSIFTAAITANGSLSGSGTATRTITATITAAGVTITIPYAGGFSTSGDAHNRWGTDDADTRWNTDDADTQWATSVGV